MSRNIEIKARIGDWNHVLHTARGMSGDGLQQMFQRDIYFDVPADRLKLRSIDGKTHQLISYRRPDKRGPKLSEYTLLPLQFPRITFLVVLNHYDVLNIVAKRRTCAVVDNVRIHLDEVDHLGRFLEFEIVLDQGTSPADACFHARELMDRWRSGGDLLCRLAGG